MVTKTTKSKEPGTLASLYLKFYNLVETLGWSYILCQLVQYYTGPKTNLGLWDTVIVSVNIFQNAALLEIVHAATGLVRSNPIITLAQVSSRIMVVCGVLMATPHEWAASSPGLPLALAAWSITEIIRYSYYLMNLIGFIPHFLVWLRYTTFIILYPIGVTGELLCFYAAVQYTSSNPEAWSYILPNPWNFTFSYRYFLIGFMLLYIPLFPKLYMHMFGQRRKILGTPAKKSN